MDDKPKLDSPTAVVYSSQPVTKDPQKPSARPKRKRWPWVVGLLLLCTLGAYFLWPKAAGTAKSDAGKKGGKKQAPASVPVTAARVTKGDIPVYVIGLGSVTPLATVTVKSRVDGELTEVGYREGDTVKAGDLLMQIDPRPYQVALTQAEGQMQKDQANLDNARTDLTRYQTLVRQRAAPEQQLATQQATVKQDEGIVKSDEGQVDAAKLNLIFCKITSPITGRVGLRLVDAGNIVHAADANGLVVLTQMDPISVLFTIAEDQLPAVLQRMKSGELAVDAFDRDMKVKLAGGTLSTVDNQIDQTTGTIRLRAIFKNTGNLFPNQFVNARLLVQTKRGVLLLPEAAIQRNSNSTFVYLVQQDSTVAVRNVQTGTTEGGNAEITSGLQAGDVVVLSGADKLDQGTKVAAQVQGDESVQNRTPAAAARKGR